MSSKQAHFFLRYALQSLGIVVLLAVLVRTFLVSSYVMTGDGMLPSIWSGDFLIGFKWGLENPHRGSVVVLRCPSDRERNCLKRVVGIPGDRIEFRGDQLVVNGDPAYKRRVGPRFAIEKVGSTRWVTWPAPETTPRPPVVVPPEHVFVLNDKRSNREDSRSWGPIPVHLLDARLIRIWLSLDWYHDGQLQAWPQVRWQRVLRGID